MQSGSYCFSSSIGRFALFCIHLFSWYLSCLPPIVQLKANTEVLQILSDPGLTPFHIHPLPLLFELIPLYNMRLLPSSLVRRVSSLPTLHDHLIQPEQYGADSRSRRSSAPSALTPLYSVCLKQCVSARRKRRGGGSSSRTP